MRGENDKVRRFFREMMEHCVCGVSAQGENFLDLDTGLGHIRSHTALGK
jgi:hypothetical protein